MPQAPLPTVLGFDLCWASPPSLGKPCPCRLPPLRALTPAEARRPPSTLTQRAPALFLFFPWQPFPRIPVCVPALSHPTPACVCATPHSACAPPCRTLLAAPQHSPNPTCSRIPTFLGKPPPCVRIASRSLDTHRSSNVAWRSGTCDSAIVWLACYKCCVMDHDHGGWMHSG